MGSMDWHEVYDRSIGDAKYAYEGQSPSKEEFIGTFEAFYSERIAENAITSWPVDPMSSHRMAKNRAKTVWADQFSDRS